MIPQRQLPSWPAIELSGTRLYCMLSRVQGCVPSCYRNFMVPLIHWCFHGIFFTMKWNTVNSKGVLITLILPHLVWPHLTWTQCTTLIGRFTVHDPVCHGCDQPQCTQFGEMRWGEMSDVGTLLMLVVSEWPLCSGKVTPLTRLIRCGPHSFTVSSPMTCSAISLTVHDLSHAEFRGVL